MTTFNRRELLSETVQSILDQSFTDFELIIVDNMSEEGTKEYVEGIEDARISYYRNPNHGVIATNRNYGIRLAKGKYVAFCDDDDLWLPNKLKIQIDALEKDKSAVMSYGQAESFLDGQVIKKKMTNRLVVFNHYLNLLRGNYIANSSVLIQKSVFDKLGLLNESSDIREDYEMWVRVAKDFEIIEVPKVLIRYRLHANNVAGSKVKETKRAIRTLRSLSKTLHIPFYLYLPNLGIHYLKCLFYKTKII